MYTSTKNLYTSTLHGTLVHRYDRVLLVHSLFLCYTGTTSVTNTLLYTSTPIHLVHRYTSTLVNWYTGTPIHRYTSTLVHQYTSTLVQRYTSTPVHQYTSTPVHRYTSTPVHWYSWYTSTPVHQYTGTRVHQYTSTTVHWYTSTPVTPGTPVSEPVTPADKQYTIHTSTPSCG